MFENKILPLSFAIIVLRRVLLWLHIACSWGKVFHILKNGICFHVTNICMPTNILKCFSIYCYFDGGKNWWENLLKLVCFFVVCSSAGPAGVDSFAYLNGDTSGIETTPTGKGTNVRVCTQLLAWYRVATGRSPLHSLIMSPSIT